MRARGRIVTFPAGALVLVDGRRRAVVRETFPEGSTSFAFPHYRVDFVNLDRGKRWGGGGDEAHAETVESNVAVAMSRVGVEPVTAPAGAPPKPRA
jgi:hypothetical protein